MEVLERDMILGMVAEQNTFKSVIDSYDTLLSRVVSDIACISTNVSDNKGISAVYQYSTYLAKALNTLQEAVIMDSKRVWLKADMLIKLEIEYLSSSDFYFVSEFRNLPSVRVYEAVLKEAIKRVPQLVEISVHVDGHNSIGSKELRETLEKLEDVLKGTLFALRKYAKSLEHYGNKIRDEIIEQTR